MNVETDYTKATPGFIAWALADHNRWRRGEGEYVTPGGEAPYTAKEVGEIIDRAVALLKDYPEQTKPPRNCDVGTAEEQFERWQAFCGRYDKDCTGCPCDDGRSCTLAYCFAKWAQMPYKEGVSK